MTVRKVTLGGLATGAVYVMVKQRGDRAMTVNCSPTEENKKMLEGMKGVFEGYQPTWFMPFNLPRMIVSFTALPDTKHLERQDIKLSDGEVISLDWLPKTYAGMKEDTPIVILVPGLTSDSSAAYANVFLEYAVLEYGFRGCILNRRGYAKMKFLKAELDPITWNKFEDLDHVLKLVEKEFPKANIYLAGTSMGANHIQKYAGLKGESQAMVNVKALGCVSSPYCILKATKHINTGYWTRKAILKTLLATFEAHLSDDRFLQALEKRNIDPKVVLSSQTSDEFNHHFSVKFTTHADVESYQKSVSSVGYIKHIDVPTLAVNSKSDLISPYSAIPFDEIALNPKYIQVSVKGGGHLEYFSGNYMRRWAFDAILTFFKNIEADLKSVPPSPRIPSTENTQK